MSETVDAAGIVGHIDYDNAGRVTCMIANYVPDTACGSDNTIQPGESENVVTETAYNADGNVLRLTAKNPATGDQATTYVYGTTLADSDVASNSLLRAEIYSDAGSGADQVTYAYNRQNQRTSLTDQNGSVHEYVYDLLGRQTADTVTTLATGVDGAIRRIETAYEVRGMVQKVTSYDTASSGSVVNEVENEYNDFAQLATQYQEHEGAVDGSTLAVNYAYVDGTGNTARPTTFTYPDGRVLSLDYGSGDGDRLSRIETLNWNSTDVSTYTYLGIATIIKENYPVPEVALDYIGSGNAYSGLDRFGRVVDQKWTGASGDVDEFTYGYDQNSNRIFRRNVVADDQPTPVYVDELYGYDAINRLIAAFRGELIDESSIVNHELSQVWQLDSTGNWETFSSYDQSTAAEALVQQRTHNAVNEITGIASIVGESWSVPQHDRNGNMTMMPQPNLPTQSYSCIWDAWNRLVLKQARPSIPRG